MNTQFNVILASGSPRRKDLLHLMGIASFKVTVSDFAENLDKSSFPSAAAYCQETSRRKVESVVASIGEVPRNTVVIGADTIVVVDNKVLEKPSDDDDAKRMLTMLSGRSHVVHTAVSLYSNALRPAALQHFDSFVETSSVTFSPLSDDDIAAYIATGEGRDKAGAYGIQGLGGQMVAGLSGCYFNIMGLPLNALSCKLAGLVSAAADGSEGLRHGVCSN